MKVVRTTEARWCCLNGHVSFSVKQSAISHRPASLRGIAGQAIKIKITNKNSNICLASRAAQKVSHLLFFNVSSLGEGMCGIMPTLSSIVPEKFF